MSLYATRSSESPLVLPVHRRADVRSARLSRSLLVVIAVIPPACGSTSPAAPSTPATPPLLTDRVVLTVDPRSARLGLPDANGGPPVVHYEPCFVVGYGGVSGATKTVQKVEDWLIGPDGTTYRYQVLDDWVDVKVGGSRGVLSRSCGFKPFDDHDIDRPSAVTYRLRVEYTVEGDYPAFRRVEMSEGMIPEFLPPRPFMTSLTLTSDFTGDPLTRRVNGPVTFIASGQGGTPPYQYLWQRDQSVIVRDWSPDPKFIWDGSGPFRTTIIEVFARSAGSSGAETRRAITFVK